MKLHRQSDMERTVLFRTDNVSCTGVRTDRQAYHSWINGVVSCRISVTMEDVGCSVVMWHLMQQRYAPVTYPFHGNWMLV